MVWKAIYSNCIRQELCIQFSGSRDAEIVRGAIATYHQLFALPVVHRRTSLRFIKESFIRCDLALLYHLRLYVQLSFK